MCFSSSPFSYSRFPSTALLLFFHPNVHLLHLFFLLNVLFNLALDTLCHISIGSCFFSSDGLYFLIHSSAPLLFLSLSSFPSPWTNLSGLWKSIKSTYPATCRLLSVRLQKSDSATTYSLAPSPLVALSMPPSVLFNPAKDLALSHLLHVFFLLPSTNPLVETAQKFLPSTYPLVFYKLTVCNDTRPTLPSSSFDET